MPINQTDLAVYLDSIASLFNRYLERFPADADRLRVLADQVSQRSTELCHRGGLPGHLTASALVFDPRTKRFLLIKHVFLKRWLQPGGHMDAGEQPVAGALRELTEEVGALPVRLHPWHDEAQAPIDIDSHTIPPNQAKNEPEHLHHDWQYLFILDETADLLALQAEEVSDYKWAPFIELHGGDYGQRLARTVEKMVRLRLV